MKCFHVLRNAPAWLKLMKNYDSHELNPIVKEKMKFIFKQWNQLIKPNYFEFREEITKIAKVNHAKISVNQIFTTALGIEKELMNVDGPYFVLFSDDDDWYNPKIIEYVKQSYFTNPTVDAILWNHCAFCSNYKQFEKLATEPYFVFKQDLTFHTNNYALTNNFFKNINTDDVNLLNFGNEHDIYFGHTNLDSYFKNKLKIVQLPEWLSMANKNITSYSFWRKNYDLCSIIDMIQICTTINSVKVPDGFSWATNEINQMMNLYKKLKFKKNL